jgi:hypothetical protein
MPEQLKISADDTGYVTDSEGGYVGQLQYDTEGDGRPYILLEIGRGWKHEELHEIADFLDQITIRCDAPLTDGWTCDLLPGHDGHHSALLPEGL